MATKKISALSTGTTANSSDKIPIERSGANYYITPTMLSTLIGGGTFIGAQAKLASTQSISDNSATNISFDTENWDTDTMYALSPNPSRITIVTDGRYEVKFWGYFASNSTGIRWAAIYEGGSLLIGVDSKGAVNGTITGLNPHAVLDLVGGNYLEIKVYQNSGGALTVAGVFDVHKVG
jgi:hypothetical protein